MPRALTILTVLLAWTSTGSAAYAHKISVFAWVENDSIQGEAYFAGGTPARNCGVELQDASEKVLGATNTDDQGKFTLPLVARDDLKVVVYAGEGHQAIYEMKSEELPAAPDDVNRAQSAEISESEPGATDVEAAIERALEKKLGPIRKQLAEMSQRKTSIKDIIAGVGFILGIFGAYALGRKSGKG